MNAHRINRAVEARAKGAHLVAANQPSACSSCTGTCNEGRDCDVSTPASLATLRVFFRTFGPYVIAVLAPLLMAAATRVPLTRALDVVSAWAALLTPAHWVVIGIFVILLAMMAIDALADCYTELKALFAHHGVGEQPLDDPRHLSSEDAR